MPDDLDVCRGGGKWVSNLVNETDGRSPALDSLLIVFGVKEAGRCQECRRFPDTAVRETLRRMPRGGNERGA